MSDADIAAEPVNARGTGRWSAELYLIFHVRRLDVWPPGDFSVRVGYAPAWGIAVPTPKALDALCDPFRPYGSVVAYYAWKGWADPDLFATSSDRAGDVRRIAKIQQRHFQD
jgi:DNA-3-methyladenine glycosylase II